MDGEWAGSLASRAIKVSDASLLVLVLGQKALRSMFVKDSGNPTSQSVQAMRSSLIAGILKMLLSYLRLF